jgi:phage gp36-like protein
VSQYATEAQFEVLGLPAPALDGFIGSVDDHLTAASGVVDSYLRGRYRLPLTGPDYPQEIVTATCILAAWTILNVRGFDPTAASDVNVRTRYEDIMGRPMQKGWLQQLAAGLVNLPLDADASSGHHDGGPRVSSRRRTRAGAGGACSDDCRGGRYDFWGNGSGGWC